MENSTYFFLVFIVTILITRVELIPRRVHSPTIHGFRLHHYMYGLVLIVVSLFFSNLTLYAIGLGLFVDELPQLITGSWRNWNDYYSVKEIVRVMVLVVLVYFLSSYIILAV